MVFLNGTSAAMAFITQYNFQRIIVNQETMGKHGLRMDGQDGLLYAPRQIDWFNDLEASPSVSLPNSSEITAMRPKANPAWSNTIGTVKTKLMP